MPRDAPVMNSVFPFSDISQSSLNPTKWAASQP
jgi:hypothetical protein